MHCKSSKWIIMIKVRISEFDIAVENNWLKVAILAKYNIRCEVQFKILKD